MNIFGRSSVLFLLSAVSWNALLASAAFAEASPVSIRCELRRPSGGG